MNESHARYLISAKAIIWVDDSIILCKNSRGEWDLPGGKLHENEELEAGLAREIKEELGLEVLASDLVTGFRHHFYDDIFILVHTCEIERTAPIQISEEHSEISMFCLEELETLNMNPNYLEAIQKATRYK